MCGCGCVEIYMDGDGVGLVGSFLCLCYVGVMMTHTLSRDNFHQILLSLNDLSSHTGQAL